MSRLLAAYLLFCAIGCKPESARKADHAAHEVVEARTKDARTRRQAETEFARNRRVRIDTLRGKHSVIASQTALITAMERQFALTDAGRAAVDLKLTAFKVRLDDAQSQIDNLRAVEPDAWEARDAAAQDAMDKLEDARKDAWDALENAPRIPHNHP